MIKSQLTFNHPPSFFLTPFVIYDMINAKIFQEDDSMKYTKWLAFIMTAIFILPALLSVPAIAEDTALPSAWNFEQSASLSAYSGITVSGDVSVINDAENHVLKAGMNSSVTFTFPTTTASRVQVKFKLKSDAELSESGYEQG